MKQFLRYQISGMIFIGWLLIFYYSGKNSDFNLFIKSAIDGDFFKNKVFYGFIVAFPIGVILHQISVNIKNHIGAKICKELNDTPEKDLISKLKDDNIEYTKYIFERISNLNSFYYVRFDNGFLAPFLALIIIVSCGYSVNPISVSIAIGLGVIILYYISTICRELEKYSNMLLSQKKIRYYDIKNKSK